MTTTPYRTILGPNQPTYQQLQLALGLNLRRQIFVAVCDDLILRDRLAAQLQYEINQASSADAASAVSETQDSSNTAVSSTTPAENYPRLVSLQLRLDEPNPLIQIAQWLTQFPPPVVDGQRLPMPAFQILGVEHLTRQAPAVQRLFFTHLQSIERNLPLLDFSLLIWTTQPWYYAIPQSAPEFWRCRTGVFEFVGDPTPLSITAPEQFSAQSSQQLLPRPVTPLPHQSAGDTAEAPIKPVIPELDLPDVLLEESPVEDTIASTVEELLALPLTTPAPTISLENPWLALAQDLVQLYEPESSEKHDSPAPEPVAPEPIAPEPVAPEPIALDDSAIDPIKPVDLKLDELAPDHPTLDDLNLDDLNLDDLNLDDLNLDDLNLDDLNLDELDLGKVDLENLELAQHEPTGSVLTQHEPIESKSTELQPHQPTLTELEPAEPEPDRAGVNPVEVDAVEVIESKQTELDSIERGAESRDPELKDTSANAITPTVAARSAIATTSPIQIPAELLIKYQQSMPLVQQIEQLHQQQASPAVLAEAYRVLGNFYRDQVEQGDVTSQNLEIAIQAYEQTLLWLPESSSLWVDVLNDMGNLYWMLSRTLPNPAEALLYLQQGVRAYQLALTKLNPKNQAYTYPMVQNNLGAAYADLARHHDPIANLELSIQSYRQALRYRTPENDSLRYASTQNNLGTTYWNLAQYKEPVTNLKYAIEAYSHALHYYDPLQEPLNYAMIQNNLGTAYWNLAQHERAQDWLILAVSSYRMALQYRTLESAPAAYAATQNNLGTAYWHIANTIKQAQDRLEYLQQAITAYETALSAVEYLQKYQPQAAPLLNFDVFATHNNLGLANYQTAIDHGEHLDITTLSSHFQAALDHHVQALQGWENKPNLRQTALNCILQTTRAAYNQLGLPGQSLALSRIPGQILPEILPRL